MKKKLSKKAQEYLKKYQDGGDFGSEDYNVATYNPNLSNISMQPLSMIPNVLQRNYQQSLVEKQKQDQLLLSNLQKQTSQLEPKETQQTIDQIGSLLSNQNPLIPLVMGVGQIIQSNKQKRDARKRQKMYDEDLKRRMEQNRTDGYYQTPYTGYGQPSTGNIFQKGGLVDPNLDQFSQFYQQQEDANSQYIQSIQNYYDQLNQMLTDKYKTTKKQGFANINQGIQGTMEALQKVATMGLKEGGRYNGGILNKYKQNKNRYQTGGKADTLLVDYFGLPQQHTDQFNKELSLLSRDPAVLDEMSKINRQQYSLLYKEPTFFKRQSKVVIPREKQEGGIINPIEGETDIYSENFNPEKFKEQGVDPVQEVLNLEVSKDTQELSQEEGLIDWVLKDEEPEYSPIEEQYYQDQPSTLENVSDISGGSVIDKIAQNESGGDYSVVNPRGGATGKYQFMPVWSGQIRDFMGLPKNLTKEQVMEEFRSNPEAQDQFMSHVVNDIYQPIVEDLRPLAKKYGFSDEQIIKLLHYRGESDTRKRLRTGNFKISDEEVQKYKNPQILDYLNR